MELEFEPRPDYLLVHAAGPFDVHRARDGLEAIGRICESHGLTRILVDASEVSTRISIADRYDLATLLAAVGGGRMRMAILVSPENMFTKTFEDTAANRGIPVRTTDSLPEALAYLELPGG
jgi:hypothetical protein